MRDRFLTRIAMAAAVAAAVFVTHVDIAGQTAPAKKPVTAAGGVPRLAGRPSRSAGHLRSRHAHAARAPRRHAAGADRRRGARSSSSRSPRAATSCNAPIDANRAAPPSGGDGSPGPYGNVGGYNNFWLDPGSRYTTVDGRKRASLLIDPPDGRVPPLTDAAQHAQRLARAARPTSDEAITRRRSRASKAPTPTTIPSSGRSASAASSASARRQGRRSCRPTSTTTCIRSCRRADTVRDPHRDGARRAHRPDERAAPAADDPQVDGRFDRPLGRRHAGRRHDELHRQDPLPRLQRRPAHRRAVHARRRQDAALPVHDRGSRPRGRSRGRRSTPGRRPTTSCTNTPATRATTRWATSCAARA